MLSVPAPNGVNSLKASTRALHPFILTAAVLALAFLSIFSGTPVFAADQPENPDKPLYHTVNSPEWLRLCTAFNAMHPYPAGRTGVFLRYYTDPMRADKDNPLWTTTFGDYFEYIFPYQGLPGIAYQPAGWASHKVGKENSVKNINYKAFSKATRMMHRKGNWIMPHVPAMQWWPATSTKESTREGALYLNMQLLAQKDPPDGFNFDAWLEAGADIDAIRKKADEVLPRGHYVMHAESHVAQPPGFNSHYMYLFGRRLKPWKDDLHGIHYIWFAIRGLRSHEYGGEWGRRLFKLSLWDTLFWGGASGYLDLPPTHYYDRERTQDYVELTRLLWKHGDLLGLVKAPAPLPKEDILQERLAVNVFDGAAPTYFPTPDSPGKDKRLYAFKTGGAPLKFGEPSYFETMPPVPDNPPKGEIFAVKYEPGYHFVTTGVVNTWRTPTRRDGEKVIISVDKGLARYGTFPARGQTVHVVRYKNILSVGRSDEHTLHVRVNKSYRENLIVEFRLERADFDEITGILSRPVINQEVVIDLKNTLGIDRLHSGDELHVRLLREHPLDRWHIPYLLCDEVILFGRELPTYSSIRNCPSVVSRGEEVVLEAEVGNDGDKPETVQFAWQLPQGWAVAEGQAEEKLNIPSRRVVRTAIRVRVGKNAPFGGQKVSIMTSTGETAGGIAINQGMDGKIVVVAPPELLKAGREQQFVSAETGGFVGVKDVTIPVTHEMPLPPAGTSARVIEYDTTGKIVNDAIGSEFNILNPGHPRGILGWMVMGNEKPYRNFCIIMDKGQAKPTRDKLLLSSGYMLIVPGQSIVSSVKNKYGIFEIKMSVPYSRKNDCSVGFKNPLPEDWSWESFDPDNPQSLMMWRFQDRDENPIVAMFDNGSGLVEISSGKKINVKGHGTVNCDKAWGDFCWPAGNARLNRFDATGFAHVYRIEWQRLYQRWYIDNKLVYERHIAMDEPLPLSIENRTKGHMGVPWIRVSSPYCRK